MLRRTLTLTAGAVLCAFRAALPNCTQREAAEGCSASDRIAAIIVRALRTLRPSGTSAPLHMTGRHVGPITYPEQQGALRTVGIFMHLAGRMHHEGAGRHRDAALGR